MPTQQALAHQMLRSNAIPEPAERELCALGLVQVPDLWPPLDWAKDAPAGPAPGPGTPSARDCEPRLAGPAGTPRPAQFAVLLTEALAGVRPARQVLPWLSPRGTVQLHRLRPLFSGEHRPRVQRVIASQPAPDVIEMTLIVATGPRTRALALRLERAATAAKGPPWRCTDIEAG